MAPVKPAPMRPVFRGSKAIPPKATDTATRKIRASARVKKAQEKVRLEDEDDDEHEYKDEDEDVDKDEFHNIQFRAPTIDTLGELIPNSKNNLAIPENGVIISEATDALIVEQMLGECRSGNLSKKRVGQFLAEGIEGALFLWTIRRTSRIEFWDRICSGWSKDLGGPIVRELFLNLCIMYQNGPQKSEGTQFYRGLDRLFKRFKGELRSELEEFVGAGSVRLPAEANMFLGRARHSDKKKVVEGTGGLHFFNNAFQNEPPRRSISHEVGLSAANLMPITSYRGFNLPQHNEREIARQVKEARENGTTVVSSGAVSLVLASSLGGMAIGGPRGPVKASKGMTEKDLRDLKHGAGVRDPVMRGLIVKTAIAAISEEDPDVGDGLLF